MSVVESVKRVRLEEGPVRDWLKCNAVRDTFDHMLSYIHIKECFQSIVCVCRRWFEAKVFAVVTLNDHGTSSIAHRIARRVLKENRSLSLEKAVELVEKGIGGIKGARGFKNNVIEGGVIGRWETYFPKGNPTQRRQGSLTLGNFVNKIRHIKGDVVNDEKIVKTSDVLLKLKKIYGQSQFNLSIVLPNTVTQANDYITNEDKCLSILGFVNDLFEKEIENVTFQLDFNCFTSSALLDKDKKNNPIKVNKYNVDDLRLSFVGNSRIARILEKNNSLKGPLPNKLKREKNFRVMNRKLANINTLTQQFKQLRRLYIYMNPQLKKDPHWGEFVQSYLLSDYYEHSETNRIIVNGDDFPRLNFLIISYDDCFEIRGKFQQLKLLRIVNVRKITFHKNAKFEELKSFTIDHNKRCFADFKLFDMNIGDNNLPSKAMRLTSLKLHSWNLINFRWEKQRFPLLRRVDISFYEHNHLLSHEKHEDFKRNSGLYKSKNENNDECSCLKQLLEVHGNAEKRGTLEYLKVSCGFYLKEKLFNNLEMLKTTVTHLVIINEFVCSHCIGEFSFSSGDSWKKINIVLNGCQWPNLEKLAIISEIGLLRGSLCLQNKFEKLKALYYIGNTELRIDDKADITKIDDLRLSLFSPKFDKYRGREIKKAPLLSGETTFVNYLLRILRLKKLLIELTTESYRLQQIYTILKTIDKYSHVEKVVFRHIDKDWFRNQTSFLHSQERYCDFEALKYFFEQYKKLNYHRLRHLDLLIASHRSVKNKRKKEFLEIIEKEKEHFPKLTGRFEQVTDEKDSRFVSNAAKLKITGLDDFKQLSSSDF